MLNIFLNFIWMLLSSVAIAIVCYSILLWLSKKSSKKSSYKIVYEYMLFILAKDHTGGSFQFESWQHLKDLGADGWEIAQAIDSDYNGISYILKRETLCQS